MASLRTLDPTLDGVPFLVVSVDGDPVTSHLDTLNPVVSLRGYPVTEYLGTLVPTGFWGLDTSEVTFCGGPSRCPWIKVGDFRRHTRHESFRYPHSSGPRNSKVGDVVIQVFRPVVQFQLTVLNSK